MRVTKLENTWHLTYLLSEWKIVPPASWLGVAAIVIASTTSSARMCSAIA